MKTQSKRRQSVRPFDFTDTKCPIPMHLDRYRVKVNGQIAMAIPVYQEGVLMFKVKTPLGTQWTEHFKEELELANFYYDELVFSKWNALA